MWLSSYLTICCLNKLSSPTDRETEMSVKHKRVLWLGSLGTETKFQMKNKFQLCDRERREDGSHKNRYVKVVMTPKKEMSNEKQI